MAGWIFVFFLGFLAEILPCAAICWLLIEIILLIVKFKDKKFRKRAMIFIPVSAASIGVAILVGMLINNFIEPAAHWQ